MATLIEMKAPSKRYSTYFIHFNTLMKKIRKLLQKEEPNLLLNIIQNIEFLLLTKLDIFLLIGMSQMAFFNLWLRDMKKGQSF